MMDDDEKSPNGPVSGDAAAMAGAHDGAGGAGRRAEARAVAKADQQKAADARRDRAAAKLRENLQRRKQQVRARRAGAADETAGLPASLPPAAKSDESS